MTDNNEQYTNEIKGSYIFPSVLNIYDINEKNILIKEIEGEVYYSTVSESGESIYTLLDNSVINVLQNSITGKNGDSLNVCVISAIRFPNANINVDYNNAVAFDFKYAINRISLGNVISINAVNESDGIVIYFTVAFKNESTDEQKANDFNDILISNDLIVLMFNQSNLIKNLTNFTSVEKYINYDTIILKKNVNFYLIDVNTLYNVGNLMIRIQTDGLYDKWSYKINENESVLVSDDVVNINITLSQVYKLYIKIYNKSYDIIKDKLLLINPNTNLEVNTDSIFDLTQTYVVSFVNNIFYINNIERGNITLSQGYRYIFDQNNSTNNQYPMSIYTTDLNIDDTSLFKNGVSYFLNNIKNTKELYKNNIGDKTFRHIEFIVPFITPQTLYYNGLLHSGIGGIINII
jgi:hypothetical protein